MNEALCSILCGEDRWQFGSWFHRSIKFNKDGTGELWCCIESCWFIAVELEWKVLSPPQPKQIVNNIRVTRTDPQLLGHLNLEITLTKRLAPGVNTSIMREGNMLNERILSDEALRTKYFTVRMEKGNFREPCWSLMGSTESSTRYALRLLFDKSPYPPREEWKEPEGAPDSNMFWDNIEFVGRNSPELYQKGIAMNDLNTADWSSCVIS
ncbi:uncharacterized protein LY89DRAFT_722759 [Mollisia scopiformis]|uniref:Uncharacterized protein n=1 Tax=Mollisia scopiformis TaxID=149040 RepID=A0A194WUL2_MOLSC|nr:uncharacterized protein LY89DRAFT_722759 [Mollisia scopiformis]KUJ11653.1 hypothetical protein LY89DRAFT_722759 [Mollisia scopiformis]